MALLFATACGFVRDDVCPLSSCRTSWFRQRSTWWLKTVRSSVSWVSWHTGQMRTGLLSSQGWGCWELTVSLSLLINRSVWVEWFFTLCWRWGPTPFGSASSLFFASSSSSSASASHSSLHFSSTLQRSFSESKSDSESETVLWFGFAGHSLRHWSMWLLKTFKSVVSTRLKHTGQVRLSDAAPSQPDVDARASTKSEAVWGMCAFVGDSTPFSVAEYLEVISQTVSTSSSCVPELAAWSCNLLAWALWKKDCWGSSPLCPPSDALCLLRQGNSTCFWHFCAGGRPAGLWTEWLDRCSFAGSSCVPWTGPLESALPGWRKPTMLLCRGFLSSELTKAEIRTPTSTKTNHLEKTAKWMPTVLLFPHAACHRPFRFISSQLY